jgi:glycosyltransferase involved in cell wall biosynthesis
MPKVSVILPNYNHEKFLVQRIESILCQDFEDYELIILDDASTDGSRQIFDTYKTHEKVSHYVINERNSGSTFVQWQKGLALAKGEYIWIAESDDYADRKFLTELVENLDSNPQNGVCFSASNWIDEKGNVIHSPSHEDETDKWQGNSLIKNEFLIGNLIYNASSAVFRKSLISKVNFDETTKFKYTGDWFFWVQVSPNISITRIEKRLNFFRRHTNNVSFKSDNEGLQFVEGIKIAQYIFKTEQLSFSKKRKTMLYWAKKIATTNLANPKRVMEQMPFEIRLYFRILNLFSKNDE